MSNMKSNLCKIRDVYRAIIDFENSINRDFGLTLNEAMLLCCLSSHDKITSTEISEALGLTCSNTSKVIKSVESKKLIKRSMGNEDKRSMLFNLTSKGEAKLTDMQLCTKELPDALKQIIS